MGACNWATRSTVSEFLNIAYHSKGDWNEYHWSNAEFDKMLASYDAELDAAKRKTLVQQMCQLISDDCGMVNPGYRQEIVAVNRAVQSFTPSPSVADYYAGVWLSK